jgi:hypothetical protein
MPFFTHPADPTAWLLPLVSGVLHASSWLFAFITLIAPVGIPILVAIVIGLFVWNLMQDPHVA